MPAPRYRRNNSRHRVGNQRTNSDDCCCCWFEECIEAAGGPPPTTFARDVEIVIPTINDQSCPAADCNTLGGTFNFTSGSYDRFAAPGTICRAFVSTGFGRTICTSFSATLGFQIDVHKTNASLCVISTAWTVAGFGTISWRISNALDEILALCNGDLIDLPFNSDTMGMCSPNSTSDNATIQFV